MAEAISVTFVVTIHTTRFDIRNVHRIIIFFLEVTRFDVPTSGKERPASVFGVPRGWRQHISSKAVVLELSEKRKYLIGPTGYLTKIPQAT